jgi:hypothetical protein
MNASIGSKRRPRSTATEARVCTTRGAESGTREDESQLTSRRRIGLVHIRIHVAYTLRSRSIRPPRVGSVYIFSIDLISARSKERTMATAKPRGPRRPPATLARQRQNRHAGQPSDRHSAMRRRSAASTAPRRSDGVVRKPATGRAESIREPPAVISSQKPRRPCIPHADATGRPDGDSRPSPEGADGQSVIVSARPVQKPKDASQQSESSGIARKRPGRTAIR